MEVERPLPPVEDGLQRPYEMERTEVSRDLVKAALTPEVPGHASDLETYLSQIKPGVLRLASKAYAALFIDAPGGGSVNESTLESLRRPRKTVRPDTKADLC